MMSLAIMLMTSCKKEKDVAPGRKSKTLSKEEKVEQLLKKIPELRIVGGKGKQLRINLRTGEYSFANPDPGYTFSTSDGVYEYVESSDGSYIAVKASAFSESGGGGTVVAGSTNLSINYTLCLSAKDSSNESGLDLFGMGFEGVSMIIGISGDLQKWAEEMQNNEEEPDEDFFETYFRGYALYIVYDSPASGSYEVVNWLENIDTVEDEPDSRSLKDKGFAYVIDFVKKHFYLSSKGLLNVNGGSIGFSGKYFSVDVSDENEELSPEDIEEVDGFGTMNCN
ncbi:MAG: hypothetical protein NZ529_08635 [Cytophagaceae bacterium]|nr:hypothetical protein [Cytophagaceae bacterium]MDW8456848.1 hypothetical protein [Cytophagaceae bacterium]